MPIIWRKELEDRVERKNGTSRNDILNKTYIQPVIGVYIVKRIGLVIG
ncbi:MAG: hypothetical protein JWQ66_1829 [Mucilaginibacter sp.]|nr:hypothetical protein [Mucilaginibacter sp.]